MKRVLLFLLMIIIPSIARAQISGLPLRISLNVAPYPDPSISDWAEHKEVAILTIVNNDGRDYDVRLGARVSAGGGLQAETKLERVPVFTIHPGVNVLYAEDLVPAEAAKFYGEVNRIVLSTGRLPSGAYQFCLRVFDAATFAPLSEEQCRPFTIRSYEGPQAFPGTSSAILPHSAGFPDRPVLRWIGLSPQYSGAQEYQVQMMEVLPGQTPAQAFRANKPVIDEIVMGTTQFVVPASFSIDTWNTYVWSVRALDAKGKALGNGPDGWAKPSVLAVSTRSNGVEPGPPPGLLRVANRSRLPYTLFGNSWDTYNWRDKMNPAHMQFVARLAFQPSNRVSPGPAAPWCLNDSITIEPAGAGDYPEFDTTSNETIFNDRFIVHLYCDTTEITLDESWDVTINYQYSTFCATTLTLLQTSTKKKLAINADKNALGKYIVTVKKGDFFAIYECELK